MTTVHDRIQQYYFYRLPNLAVWESE